MPEKPVDYSIVIPVYCNEGSLSPLMEAIENDVIARNPDLHCEVIFVDDGSKDDSLKELLSLKEKHPNLIKVIKLTRNFGQLPAVCAGYKYAKGKCVINIAADLQDPPELINDMLNSHFNENYEIVVCHRESREDSYFITKTSQIFYRLVKKLSFPDMPSGGFDIALISRKVKNLILEMQEANPFWQGQLMWTGYRIKFIPFKRNVRKFGKSKYTVSKKIKILIDSVTSYSYFPLRLMSVVGCIVALMGFLYATVIVFARIFGNVPFKGWAPIMILVLVLSGIQMLMLGIIGEYLWRVLDQVRNRLPYIIEKTFD